MFDFLEHFHISLQQFGRDLVNTARQCIETICGFGLSALISRIVCEGFELHPEDSSVFDYISHVNFLRESGPGASVRTSAPGLDIVYRFIRLACPAIRCRLRFRNRRRRMGASGVPLQASQPLRTWEIEIASP